MDVCAATGQSPFGLLCMVTGICSMVTRKVSEVCARECSAGKWLWGGTKRVTPPYGPRLLLHRENGLHQFHVGACRTVRQPHSLNPSAPPCDQMDHDQHDSDHEQNPRNLDRNRCHPGDIQSTGNQANNQKQECKVEHGLPSL